MQATVNTTNLRKRDSAGTNGNVLGYWTAGETFEVEELIQDDSYQWVKKMGVNEWGASGTITNLELYMTLTGELPPPSTGTAFTLSVDGYKPFSGELEPQ